MNQRQYEARRQYLVALLKKARGEGNKGAENFIRKELEALDVVKVR
jgi:hypothetical protein